MADNVTLQTAAATPASGTVFAADDIAGVQHPRAKLSLGADGTATDAIGVSNGLDSTGTGVQAVGVVGQLDDTATGAVTENQFAPVRISSRRALLVEGVASGTAQSVGGDVASGATDSGNPIKAGGVYRSTLPTIADGQRGDLQINSRGAAYVTMWGTSGGNPASMGLHQWTGADSITNSAVISLGPTTTYLLAQAGFLSNGSTWDRARGNTEGTLLASAARTATVSSADQTNYNARGVLVALNVSSAGTGSITLKIEGKDPVSGSYYTLLEGAAVAANSLNVYKVYPGITVAANAAASDVVPRTWRATVTHNNANSITYSVAFATVL